MTSKPHQYLWNKNIVERASSVSTVKLQISDASGTAGAVRLCLSPSPGLTAKTGFGTYFSWKEKL